MRLNDIKGKIRDLSSVVNELQMLDRLERKAKKKDLVWMFEATGKCVPDSATDGYPVVPVIPSFAGRANEERKLYIDIDSGEKPVLTTLVDAIKLRRQILSNSRDVFLKNLHGEFVEEFPDIVIKTHVKEKIFDLDFPGSHLVFVETDVCTIGLRLLNKSTNSSGHFLIDYFSRDENSLKIIHTFYCERSFESAIEGVLIWPSDPKNLKDFAKYFFGDGNRYTTVVNPYNP